MGLCASACGRKGDHKAEYNTVPQNAKEQNNEEDGDSYAEDENKARGNWTRQLDFILSCVGYAVGLGNIWRFPYLCMINGGGAFLIPYFIFLFLCGIPLFFMELSIGQFSSLSPLSVWRLSPMFKGVGYGMMAVSAVWCVYYNLIVGWCLYYLALSFNTRLPWEGCDNTWNDDNCVMDESGKMPKLVNVSYTNSSMNTTVIKTVISNETSSKMTAAEQFWAYNVLEITDGMHDLGGIRWQLLLCLFAAWVIVFLCLFKGVKSLGKVVYVTAIAPYIFLLILFIRGLMLEGSKEGILFYISPKWHRLGEFKIWADACQQIFISLGPAWGGLITMASYNRFNNNCYRDAIMVPIINCGTSFFAGFVIFSVIGHMAHKAGVDVEDVINSGPGLAFIAYPQALSTLPISPFWAVLFFLMLLTLGLDSQFGAFEGIVSSIVDESWERLHKYKIWVTLGACVFEFLLGLVLVTRAGVYIFQILDWYASAFSVMIIALSECICVAYVYGAEQLYRDIELMIGRRPVFLFKVCWYAVTPVCVTTILIFSMLQFSVPTYGKYKYPSWALAIGWTVATFSVTPIPIYMIYKIITSDEIGIVNKIRSVARPSPEWGPAVEKYRKQYRNGSATRTSAVYVQDSKNDVDTNV